MPSSLRALLFALCTACDADRAPLETLDTAPEAELETRESSDTAPPDDAAAEASDDTAGEIEVEVIAEVPWDAADLAAPDADEDIAARLQAAIERAIAEAPVGATMAAVQQGNDWTWVGSAQRPGASGKAPRTDRPFRIGSVTKTFVGLVVLDLVARGELTLDAPIATWFPELTWSERITVADLLGHTSGVGDYFESDALVQRFIDRPLAPVTFAELYAAIVAVRPAFEPGTAWAYANSNYILLGELAARVGGLPFGALLAERVTDPLGLTATGFEPESPPPAPLVPGHGTLFGPEGAVHLRYDPAIAWTAGAMYATAPELARVLLAMGRGYLPAAAVRAAWLDPRDDSPDFDYGLGVMRLDVGTDATPGPFVIGHNGNIWGYDTFAVVMPERDLAIVALVDHDEGTSSAIAIALLEALGARD